MGTRILTWHHKEAISSNEPRIGPTYYIEADYTPVAVRIHAETAPGREAKVDIYDDGVSIFNNRTPRDIDIETGVESTKVAVTAAILGKGLNSEEHAEDFSMDIDGETVIIEKGSWVYCNLEDSGDGKNFTVHLELYTGDEELTEEE